MEPVLDELRSLALLLTANAVPVVMAKLAPDRGALPLDFGWVMPDGERLLGSHKTWRGLLSGTVASALVAVALGLPAWVGAGFAALSLAADAGSSIAKRRMHLEPGTEVLALDQLAEALVPLLAFAGILSLQFGEILAVTATFVALDTLCSPLRHRRWL